VTGKKRWAHTRHELEWLRPTFQPFPTQSPRKQPACEWECAEEGNRLAVEFNTLQLLLRDERIQRFHSEETDVWISPLLA
jgi:hypothetical protein